MASSGVDWRFDPEKPIPILINPQMLLAWNQTFSSSYNFPKADVKTVSAIPLYIAVRDEQTMRWDTFEARVVGVSPKSPIFAPLVPLDFVEAMNERSFGADFEAPFMSLVVELENPTYVDDVLERTRAMGFEAGGEQRVAEMIDMAINVLTLFLAAISLIIVLISLINVFNIFLINVMERRFEIGMMRAVGASRANIRAMVLLEAAVVGLGNGVAGVLFGVLAIIAVEPFFAPFLKQFVGEGITFFIINPLFLLAVFIASPLVNMLAVFRPAADAARLDPVQALRR